MTKWQRGAILSPGQGRQPEAAWPLQRKAGIHIHHGRCKMKEKKQWQKPALIVLVRRKLEEAVLGYCKDAYSNGPGLYECLPPDCKESVLT